MADVSLEAPDFSKLKVPDLKKELKSKGLSTTGNKTELIQRLQSSLKSPKAGLSDSIIDDIEEDLLNDEGDDDEHIDDRAINLINELDHDLDDLPKSLKRKAESESELIVGPPKKIILKRNTSETVAAVVKPEVKSADTTTIEKHEVKSELIGDRKVIKLTELSIKERLEMRAKKFGVTSLTDETKKLARAERFGSTTTTSNSSASIKLNTPNTSIDVLKQRAARFGGSVSNVMSNLENQEKKEKRKERFGGTTSSVKSPVEIDLAKAARLERFKTTVK
ncbi:SAP domain-containing ribonucleoprotein [Dendroctonus ponderosae]|uniref:SAP domain-containing protein n=1 Tax=Dendroctonus ponderosae TaxID=77166 RepID=U4ULZ2_DENPD|nr:SAP domain-containing ribonucleoprotein [Dendroctonus ponderosae]ERL93493.1 hypothetical protein D910_10782 [Dendroctonus ponderosae]KAH1024813.1 hypothetical protein HUJ05_004247 [Dendroctonus ponderosae]